MRISTEMHINVSDILRAHGCGESKRAQERLAHAVAQFAEDYVPQDTGFLAHNAVQIASDGSEIRYVAPYAARQYYTDAANHQNNASGLRGKQWIPRMLADRKAEILAQVAKEVGGNAK